MPNKQFQNSNKAAAGMPRIRENARVPQKCGKDGISSVKDNGRERLDHNQAQPWSKMDAAEKRSAGLYRDKEESCTAVDQRQEMQQMDETNTLSFGGQSDHCSDRHGRVGLSTYDAETTNNSNACLEEHINLPDTNGADMSFRRAPGASCGDPEQNKEGMDLSSRDQDSTVDGAGEPIPDLLYPEPWELASDANVDVLSAVHGDHPQLNVKPMKAPIMLRHNMHPDLRNASGVAKEIPFCAWRDTETVTALPWLDTPAPLHSVAQRHDGLGNLVGNAWECVRRLAQNYPAADPLGTSTMVAIAPPVEAAGTEELQHLLDLDQVCMTVANSRVIVLSDFANVPGKFSLENVCAMVGNEVETAVYCQDMVQKESTCDGLIQQTLREFISKAASPEYIQSAQTPYAGSVHNVIGPLSTLDDGVKVLNAPNQSWPPTTASYVELQHALFFSNVQQSHEGLATVVAVRDGAKMWSIMRLKPCFNGLPNVQRDSIVRRAIASAVDEWEPSFDGPPERIDVLVATLRFSEVRPAHLPSRIISGRKPDIPLPPGWVWRPMPLWEKYFDIETIHLFPGDVLVMPPGQCYMTFSPVAGAIIGYHLYNYHWMHLTEATRKSRAARGHAQPEAVQRQCEEILISMVLHLQSTSSGIYYSRALCALFLMVLCPEDYIAQLDKVRPPYGKCEDSHDILAKMVCHFIMDWMDLPNTHDLRHHLDNPQFDPSHPGLRINLASIAGLSSVVCGRLEPGHF